MQPKKTLKVKDIIEKANHMLEHSTCSAKERHAIASFVGDLLHQAHAYQGFGYLESEGDMWKGFYGQDGRIFFYLDHRLRED